MTATISCERCHGSGHIRQPSLLSEYAACPDCDGNGYLVTESTAVAQSAQESLSPQIEALIPFSSAADGIPPNLPDEFEILLKIDATPFARVTVGEFRATRHALTASQPSPAATVERVQTFAEAAAKIRATRIETTYNLATGERDNEETDPAYFRSSAASGDAIKFLKDTASHITAGRYLDAKASLDEAYKVLTAEPQAASSTKHVPYGIIDPEYARVFTMARCLAWAEGYALLFHGSFTRDLDLIAVPWTSAACEPEHLVKRIVAAADLRSLDEEPSAKEHGRLSWTLVFKKFGDPRFIDFSTTPRILDEPQEVGITRRHEADAFYKILQTIARFPITDPKNMDAVNMRLIAEGALAVSQPRVPKVRTSHRRNKEEAARLQTLVDEAYSVSRPESK